MVAFLIFACGGFGPSGYVNNMIMLFDILKTFAGLVREDSSEAGFTSIRSVPGLQRGELCNCECISLLHIINW